MFLLAIVMSVLFRFTDSDYLFGIFKLFLVFYVVFCRILLEFCPLYCLSSCDLLLLIITVLFYCSSFYFVHSNWNSIIEHTNNFCFWFCATLSILSIKVRKTVVFAKFVCLFVYGNAWSNAIKWYMLYDFTQGWERGW